MYKEKVKECDTLYRKLNKNSPQLVKWRKWLFILKILGQYLFLFLKHKIPDKSGPIATDLSAFTATKTPTMIK